MCSTICSKRVEEDVIKLVLGVVERRYQEGVGRDDVRNNIRWKMPRISVVGSKQRYSEVTSCGSKWRECRVSGEHCGDSKANGYHGENVDDTHCWKLHSGLHKENLD